MREQDLAAVLFDRGVQSGLGMEQVIDELGAINWPSFIDGQAFRQALAEAAEIQLRRQMEDQLALIRRRIGAPGSVVGMSMSPSPSPSPAPVATPSPRSAPATVVPAAAPAAAATPVVMAAQPPAGNPTPAPVQPATPPPTPAATPVPAAAGPAAAVGRVIPDETLADDDMPNDATMVWITHHGQRPESE